MFKVKVFDKGLVTLCEIKDGKWVECKFPTHEEAEKALIDYQNIWGRGGYVYEDNERRTNG